jgi:hypothetical protein
MSETGHERRFERRAVTPIFPGSRHRSMLPPCPKGASGNKWPLRPDPKRTNISATVPMLLAWDIGEGDDRCCSGVSVIAVQFA